MKVYKVSINDIGSHGWGFKLVLASSPEEAKELVDIEITRQKEIYRQRNQYNNIHLRIESGEPQELMSSPGIFWVDMEYSNY